MIYTDFKRILTDSKQINADIRENQQKISGNPSLLYADLTYKVRGAIFEVYNTLGSGHKEQVYQKALEKEFKEMKIHFQKEESLDVNYKGEIVGNYRPDFVIDDKVILEIKAVDFMPNFFEQQLIHYLKTTNYQVGLLVNFGQPKLFIKRIIWTNPRKSVLNPRKSKYNPK